MLLDEFSLAGGRMVNFRYNFKRLLKGISAYVNWRAIYDPK